MKSIFILYIFLSTKLVQTTKFCHCNCCTLDSCSPPLIGSVSLGEFCNSTNCNRQTCFSFNGTLCPAPGSDGIVYPICSHANIIFQNLTFFFVLLQFLAFIQLYS